MRLLARDRLVRLTSTLLVLLALFSVSACSRPEPDLVTSVVDPGAVMRGKTLAQGLAACGFCHGQNPEPGSPLAGGREWFDKYGAVVAPNITSSQSGIGHWTTNQIVDSIRRGLNQDGEMLSPEVHRGYEWMSDDDVLSIVSYLRSLEPIDHSVERREISLIDRNTTGFFDSEPEVRGYVPAIEKRFELEYGRYLTEHVARCQSCHSSPGDTFVGGGYLGGGRMVHTSAGERLAPGIGNTQIDGLGSWSEDDIVKYLRSGETPDGLMVEPEYCPTGFYRNVVTEDLRAIAHFLKALPPG